MAAAFDVLGVSYEEATTMPDDLNLYSSIFLCLGIFSNNTVLSSVDGQKLATYLNEGGTLYMEGGDTWAYDNQTVVHEMFGIYGLVDGSDDLGTINGVGGTFTEGISFGYNGDNSWIDHLEAIGSGELIFNNQLPAYGCAVANDAGNYKTIGVSFEFGGLANTDAERNELMDKFLTFFGFGGTSSQEYVIDLPAGWTGISSYLEPDNLSIENVLSGISGQLSIIQNMQGFYQPGNGSGNLQLWDSQSGYCIKVDEPVQLIINGNPPDSKSIQLTEGWNLIPVLSNDQVEIEILFAGKLSNVLIIKEAMGKNMYWPEMDIGSLKKLSPGCSYLIKVNEDFVISY
jgi:hypothetical protein